MDVAHGIPALRQVVLDSTDPRGLAEFYCQLLGYHYRPGDEAPAGDVDPSAEEWLVLYGEGGALGWHSNMSPRWSR